MCDSLRMLPAWNTKSFSATRFPRHTAPPPGATENRGEGLVNCDEGVHSGGGLTLCVISAMSAVFVVPVTFVKSTMLVMLVASAAVRLGANATLPALSSDDVWAWRRVGDATLPPSLFRRCVRAPPVVPCAGRSSSGAGGGGVAGGAAAGRGWGHRPSVAMPDGCSTDPAVVAAIEPLTGTARARASGAEVRIACVSGAAAPEVRHSPPSAPRPGASRMTFAGAGEKAKRCCTSDVVSASESPAALCGHASHAAACSALISMATLCACACGCACVHGATATGAVLRRSPSTSLAASSLGAPSSVRRPANESAARRSVSSRLAETVTLSRSRVSSV